MYMHVLPIAYCMKVQKGFKMTSTLTSAQKKDPSPSQKRALRILGQSRNFPQ